MSESAKCASLIGRNRKMTENTSGRALAEHHHAPGTTTKRKFGDNGFGGIAGYMDLRKQKLQRQFLEDQHVELDVFGGATFWINGRTEPPADELEALLSRYGGVRELVKTTETDFEVVEYLPRAKRVKLLPHHKIIHTSFILDSVVEKKLANWELYRHFEDVYLKVKPRKSVINTLTRPSSMEKKAAGVKLPENDERDTIMPSLAKFLNGKELPKSWSDFNHPRKSIYEFYKNSRLHWLSTWRTELTDWARESVTGQIRKHQSTWVMHIDIDCFFVSVALKKYPNLRGKPVVICHGSGNRRLHSDMADIAKERSIIEKKRKIELKTKMSEEDSRSEIASCSYEARAKGCRNGMYLGAAFQLCPELVCVEYDLEECAVASEMLYDSVQKFTDCIEPVSCDELYADITDCVKEPASVAAEIRAHFEERSGLNASVGIGPNKLIARLATAQIKPNGQLVVEPKEIKDFIDPVPVQKLPGVGPSMLKKLMTKYGEVTCAELKKSATEIDLQKVVGVSNGERLYAQIRGHRTPGLDEIKDRKSLSVEINYGCRFKNWVMAQDFVVVLSNYVHQKLVLSRQRAKKMTVKVSLRDPEAPFEPSKYGGMGLCLTESATSSFRKTATVDGIATIVFNTIKDFSIEPWEIRGVGIHLDLQPLAAHMMSDIHALWQKRYKERQAENEDQSEEDSESSDEEWEDPALLDPEYLKLKEKLLRKNVTGQNIEIKSAAPALEHWNTADQYNQLESNIQRIIERGWLPRRLLKPLLTIKRGDLVEHFFTVSLETLKRHGHDDKKIRYFFSSEYNKNKEELELQFPSKPFKKYCFFPSEDK